MKWDPVKYVQFGDYRDRPFFDLTGRIRAEAPRNVVDLGCGPGNLTATLARRWPEATVVGLDSSGQMLAKAAVQADGHKNLNFEQADIAGWMPSAATDVVVTNAALQWVPGHQEMLARWLEALQPGAWFAMQVPGNFNAPSHTLMRALAGSAPWAAKLAGVLRGGESVGSPLTTWASCWTPAAPPTPGKPRTSRSCPGRVRCWNGSGGPPCGRSWLCSPRRTELRSNPNTQGRCGRHIPALAKGRCSRSEESSLWPEKTPRLRTPFDVIC